MLSAVIDVTVSVIFISAVTRPDYSTSIGSGFRYRHAYIDYV